MPLIIDANRTGDFTRPKTQHAKEILVRVSNKRMRICIGGKLTTELLKTKLAPLIQEWLRAGQVVRTPDADVRAEADKFVGTTTSDDEHILAVAKLSGCRLLYSSDQALIADFKNTGLIHPKGKIVTPSTKARIANALFERLGN